MSSRRNRKRWRPLGLAVALLAAAGLALAVGCGGDDASGDEGLGDRAVRVTTTTNFITDLAREIGGDRAEVTGLMGAGVDPHLFKASAGDVGALRDADLILYGGLELEGRMTDLLVELASERKTVAVTKDIPEGELREPSEFEGKFDPHVWFDVGLWRNAAETVAEAYAEVDPEHAEEYRERAAAYDQTLVELDAYVEEQAASVPESQRVLVTSHDAFGYLGDRYGFEVAAIQGTSTATEATTADIERVADLIVDRQLKAVFVESSVPRQTIDAVLAAAERKGQSTRVGGELFGDAAGDEGTPEGTYEGMVRHNIDLIVGGLR